VTGARIGTRAGTRHLVRYKSFRWPDDSREIFVWL
jgi:hypothetical protein